jgi:rare lipoprotein A
MPFLGIFALHMIKKLLKYLLPVYLWAAFLVCQLGYCQIKTDKKPKAATAETATVTSKEKPSPEAATKSVNLVKNTVKLDSIGRDETALVPEQVDQDSICTEENYIFKRYKRKAHASYYSDRLKGRRTASGQRFDNNKWTAAHKKLPMGTKLRVTNEANGKSIMVTINDRGPFSRVRDIDLTKRAFRHLSNGGGSGSMIVTLEIAEEKTPVATEKTEKNLTKPEKSKTEKGKTEKPVLAIPL